MAAKPTINWWEPSKRKNVDGSMLPSDTAVRLSSRHHLIPPNEYVVYKLLPKAFWKLWGAEREEVTRLDALEYRGSAKNLGSRYYSEPLWNLPAPPNQAGSATFRACTDTGDASSGKLGSARIWLEEISAGGRVGGSVGAHISAPSISIGPKVAANRDFQRHWRVRVVEDPWVEITVLQAEPVIDHLRLLEDECEIGASQPHSMMRDLPPETMIYFVDRPMEEVSLTYRLEPAEPLTVAVQVQGQEGLRATICLRVHDLDNGSAATTPPIFLTHLRGHLFATDLTIDLLRNEPRDLLLMLMLNEDDLNVERLARRLSQDVQTTWGKLIEAADELGVDSVGEAATFVALSTRP